MQNVHINNTHTPGPFSGITRVGRYQKGKTNLGFTEARDSEWQWHQLGYVHVCTSLQTDNHASTPPLSFFTGRMPFLLPNQQCQSTEGTSINRLLLYLHTLLKHNITMLTVLILLLNADKFNSLQQWLAGQNCQYEKQSIKHVESH